MFGVDPDLLDSEPSEDFSSGSQGMEPPRNRRMPLTVSEQAQEPISFGQC